MAERGILPEHPRKFSVAMVKLKSFAVNAQIVENPFCQCKICSGLRVSCSEGRTCGAESGWV
jgi:hypothetical protein